MVNSSPSVDNLLRNDSSSKVNLKTLFQYSTKLDKIMILIGVTCSIVSGVMFPLLSYIFGKLIDEFIYVQGVRTKLSHVNGTNTSAIASLNSDIEDFRTKAFTASATVMAMAVIYFITISIYVWSFNKVAMKQTFRIRAKFVDAMFNLDIGRIECTPSLSAGSIATTLLTNLSKIEEGIGERIGNIFNYVTVIIANIAVSLTISWKLTLILLSLTPLIIASIGLVQWSINHYSDKMRSVKTSIGILCKESFSMIKTVTAFNGQKCQVSKFNEICAKVLNILIFERLFLGIGMGLFFFFTFLTYGLGVYIGTKFIISGGIVTSSIGGVLVVFWNVAMISMIIVPLTPNILAVQSATSAARTLFDVINSNASDKDASDKNRKKKTNNKRDARKQKNKNLINGAISRIDIQNVSFSYPSRPETTVLKNVSLSIKSGQTVAFVGPSGSGKSTLFELIQKFYDANDGAILINGNNIKSLDPKSLRNQISVVGQEPVLFEGTICENIVLGKSNVDASNEMVISDQDMEHIKDAARRANAHEFIDRQNYKYSTKLSDKSKLSGGQKQRIAIARALIRNSSLLLLDEATSALDAESGMLINESMKYEKQIFKDRITLIVAHKLDDVKDADQIYVFKYGEIVEQGTHNQLMHNQGLYHEMYETQKMIPEDKKDEKDEDSYMDMAPLKKMAAKFDRLSFRRTIKRRSQRVSYLSLILPKEDADDVVTRTVSSSGASNHVEIKFSALTKYLMKCKFSVFLGIVSTIICGFWVPLYAVLIGDFSKIHGKVDDQKMRDAEDIAFKFLAVGAIIGIGTIFSRFFFGRVAAYLCQDLRAKVFASVLSKPISWFESSDNSEGTLIMNVITNIDCITDYFNYKFPGLIQNLSTLISVAALSFHESWKVTIVILIFVPINFYLASLESHTSSNMDAELDDEVDEDLSNILDIEKMASLVIKIMDSMKTITSFNLQKYFTSKLDAISNDMKMKANKSFFKRAVIVGASKASLPVIFAVTFFLASHWISIGELNFHEFLIIMGGKLIGCILIAEDSITLFDVTDEKLSLQSILSVISEDDNSTYGPSSVKTGTELRQKIKGPIKLKNVDFSYPSRPSQIILKNFNLEISERSKIAIIGESGSGKSTISTLLLKYYPPIRGTITLNGCLIDNIDDNDMRSSIAIVNQEPDLFSFSILENIIYGSYDDPKDIRTIQGVISAATKAQIHDAINRLPDGYRTPVGDKGGQLSGGQKQRIAIARAFYKNPEILILDEATSALDALSKSLVEDAIDSMASDKIIISITHDNKSLDRYDKVYTVKDKKINCVK